MELHFSSIYHINESHNQCYHLQLSLRDTLTGYIIHSRCHNEGTLIPTLIHTHQHAYRSLMFVVSVLRPVDGLVAEACLLSGDSSRQNQTIECTESGRVIYLQSVSVGFSIDSCQQDSALCPYHQLSPKHLYVR